MATIVVGMSGGVDSSVAAALLRDRGHRVVGVTLHLWDYTREGHAGRCCAPEDQYDARRVCDELGIAHYTFDRRELFRTAVVDRFVDDYLDGRTPSPCVRCNESVKIGPLWEIAKRLGADRVATGHYARVSDEGRDGVALRVARDVARDQSYFLFVAPQEALRALELPLGDMTKAEVREYAARIGLGVASKPDSTDLCFVEGQDYASWVDAHAGSVRPRAGEIRTVDGRVVGRHDGIHRFTVGQRRGIGAVDGEPKYVLRILPDEGAVVVGGSDDATARAATLREFRWIAPEPAGDVVARLRYRHAGVRATVRTGNIPGEVQLDLAEPQRGVAPGQAAVLYAGDRVVGGGFIA